MAYGTAPHRDAQGRWVTYTGRVLTPAGQQWWEHHYRAGQTDGRGHVVTGHHNSPTAHQPAPERPTPVAPIHPVRSQKEWHAYVSQALTNPHPNYQEELGKLGFQGASEVDNARRRFQTNVKRVVEPPQLTLGGQAGQMVGTAFKPYDLPAKPAEPSLHDYALAQSLQVESNRPDVVAARQRVKAWYDWHNKYGTNVFKGVATGLAHGLVDPVTAVAKDVGALYGSVYHGGGLPGHEGTPPDLGHTNRLMNEWLYQPSIRVSAAIAHGHAPSAMDTLALLSWVPVGRPLGLIGRGVGRAALMRSMTEGQVSEAARLLGKETVSRNEAAHFWSTHRAFNIGKPDEPYYVAVPNANSVTGRTIEATADAIRPKLHAFGLMKSEAERGRLELRHQNLRAASRDRTAADLLAKHGRKLTIAQEQALKLVVEGTDPAERVAFHRTMQQTLDNPDYQAYHKIHEYNIAEASQYVNMVTLTPEQKIARARQIGVDPARIPDQVPVLSANAPKDLRAAYKYFLQVTQGREDIYTAMTKALDTSTNEQAASELLNQGGQAFIERRHAPGRIIKGARYQTWEAQIQNAMEQSSGRQALQSFLSEQVLDPHEVEANMAMADAVVRNAARVAAKNGENPLKVVEDTYGSFTRAPEGAVPPLAPQQHQIDTLYQAAGDTEEGAQHYFNENAAILRASGGKPFNAKSAPRIVALLTKLRQRAVEGAAYRTWYEDSAKAILDHVGGDRAEAVKLAKLLAIYSPRARVWDESSWNNITRAIGAYDDFKRTGQVSDKWSLSKQFGPAWQEKVAYAKETGGEMPTPGRDWQTEAAQNAMTDGEQWGGLKTNSFYKNFLEDIDPKAYRAEFGAEKPVTIDTWMRRAFDYPRTKVKTGKRTGKLNENISEDMYKFMAQATEMVGHTLGWTPKQAQAAIWTSIKAELEGTALDQAGFSFADALKAYREKQAAAPSSLFQEAHTPPHELSAQMARFAIRQSHEAPTDWAAVAQERSVKDAALAAQEPDGGFTLHGDLSPDTGGGFAVSIAGHEQIVPHDTVTPDAILAYKDSVAPLLEGDHSLRIGGWHDPEDGKFYFDVSKVFPDRETAMQFARENDQKAIFNKETFQSEPVEGFSGRPQEFTTTQPEAPSPPPSDAPKQFGDTGSPEDILFQRSGKDPEWMARPYTVKGWTSFDLHSAVMGMTDIADETTLHHEFMHIIRRFGLTPKQEKQIASEMGATPIRDAEKKIIGYEWNRQAEENFVNATAAFIRRGVGPKGLEGAFSTVAPAFRAIFEGAADVPDLSPAMARFVNRLYKERPAVKGGRIVGHEDWAGAIAYSPNLSGSPLHRVTDQERTLSKFLRWSSGKLTHRHGTVVGAKGPTDEALTHQFTGGEMLTGRTTPDVILPAMQHFFVAKKIEAFRDLHETLVAAGRDLPQDVTDIPVWKTVPTGKEAERGREAIRRYYEDLAGHEGSLKKIHAKYADDLSAINADALHKFRQDVITPDTIEGESARAVAERLTQPGAEPIKGVVWVPRNEVAMQGVLHVPAAARLQNMGLTKVHKAVLQSVGFGVDALNDFQKALILYLNPAYIPINLIGNVGMNLMQQGVFAAPNLWRSVMMHWKLDAFERAYIDRTMGSGLVQGLGMATTPGQFLHSTLGHWINNAVDLVPRRASFLHEAHRLGYRLEPHDGQLSLRELLKNAAAGDEGATRTLDDIAQKAKDAIVDYDRMGPLEREVLSRIIFFYPWIRGATRYTRKFITEHPLESMAIAMAYEHAQAQAQKELGDRPFYANLEFPVNTETLGLKIPGTGVDVGLDQLVGKHELKRGDLPMVISARQYFTMTTALEVFGDTMQFITARDRAAAGALVGHLTPVPYAAIESLVGYDPFKHKEVSPGAKTFLSAFGYQGTPLSGYINKLRESDQQTKERMSRSLHPRTKADIAGHIAHVHGIPIPVPGQMELSSMAPAPYNPETGQGLALKNASTEKQRTVRLEKQAKDVGVPPPSPNILDDLHWKTKLDKQIHANQTYTERLQIAQKVYEEKTGHKFNVTVSTEGQAQRMYQLVSHMISPTYDTYQRIVNSRVRKKKAVQPSNG